MFAIMGTVISAMVVGGGIYLLGQVRITYLYNPFSHAHYFWTVISVCEGIHLLCHTFVLMFDVPVNSYGHVEICLGLPEPSLFAYTGPRSAVGNLSGYRCKSDCRSRGCEFDPGPVPYFRGD